MNIETNKHLITYITLFLISLYSVNIKVHAETSETQLKTYGISMHDVPALQKGEHLPYTNPEAPSGGTLKQAAIGTYDTLNPFNIKGKAASGLHLAYDRLTIRSWDEPFTLYPLIAEDIKLSEDRLTIDIFINKRAQFSDGSSITGDDVIFSYNILKDKGRPNMRRIYGLAESVEKIGKYHIRIQLSEGANRESAMIFAMMPVLPKKFWEDKDFNATLTKHPITSGPYRIQSFDLGRRITYERNPSYWAKDLPIVKGLYNFDRVIYEYFRDDDVALMAFNAGELNYRREFNISKWSKGYESKNGNSKKIIQDEILHGRTDRAYSLIFNTRRAPFDQIAVRKAFSNVIDFNWINKNLYHDLKKRHVTFFPNADFSSFGTMNDSDAELVTPFMHKLPSSIVSGSLKTVDYNRSSDVRKYYKHADFMLRQAGWSIEEGTRTNTEKNMPLEFEIIVQSSEDEKIALAFQRGLKRLGVVPKVRRLDSAAFQRRMQNYDYDMVIHNWNTSLSPGTEQYLYWSCEAANSPSQWNYAGICHPAIDHLVKNVANTQTRKELASHMRMLDRILTHLHIAIPLFHSNKDYVAYTENLARPEKDALYGVIIESWWRKAKK